MLFSIDGIRVKTVRIRNTPSDPFTLVEKVNCDGVLVYTAAQGVSYAVDTGVVYEEEVSYGASCLSPTTFTPSKSGYEFVGWREDATANKSVLSEKVMGDEPVVLYAVFKKSITKTFVSYNKTETKSGILYYNNGNVQKAAIVAPTGATYSTWEWRGWSNGSEISNADVYFESGATLNGTVDSAYYGLYQKELIVSYNGNNSTSGSTASQGDLIRYYNASGNYKNPKVTLRSNGFKRTYYSFSKWAKGSTSGTQYAAGTDVTITEDTTFYAIWTQVGAKATAKVTSGVSASVTGWNDVTFGSFSVTPNNSTYFSIGSDYKLITVKKACTVAITFDVSASGEPRFVLTKNGATDTGNFIFDKYASGKYTTSVSLSAGTTLSIKFGTTTTGVTSSFDSCTLTLTVG